MHPLYAIYDLEVSPITFDVTKFLLLAEQYRVEHNYSELNVIIVGPSELRLAKLTERYSSFSEEVISSEFFENRIDKLFEPLITLTNGRANWRYVHDRNTMEKYVVLGHVFPVNYTLSHPVSAYGVECLIDLLNNGEVLPSLSAEKNQQVSVDRYLAQYELQANKTLAIFLRQTPYETWRNSDMAGWTSFANKRIAEGYHIVWFNDSESIDDGLSFTLPGVFCRNENILFRAAFTSRCAACFLVNGGMATLARYNHQVISATFKLSDENSPATSKQFWANKGIAYGQQLRFLSPLHHNEWLQDNVEVIEKVWQEHVLPKLSLCNEEKLRLVKDWRLAVKGRAESRRMEILNYIDAQYETYIWGSGNLASLALATIQKYGHRVSGILDSYRYGDTLHGFTLRHPNELKQITPKNIVVATGDNQTPEQFARIVMYCSRFLDHPCQLIDFNTILFSQK